MSRIEMDILWKPIFLFSIANQLDNFRNRNSVRYDQVELSDSQSGRIVHHKNPRATLNRMIASSPDPAQAARHAHRAQGQLQRLRSRQDR